MEKDKQIKGKGNGDIHPKYIKYVVAFLEKTGQEVRESEMNHLGYVDISKIKDAHVVFNDLFKKKYFFKKNPIVDKEGNPYQSVLLWEKFGLFSFDAKFNIKWNFDIGVSVQTFIKNITKGKLKSNTGHRSAASNTGDCSAASNTGDYSAASNTGDYSAASNTGHYSAASNTGHYSAASNTGDHSAASNTGHYSAASNTGHYSAASNTGDYSAASNTGHYSAASNTGHYSAASNTGDRSAASNTGDCSAASNTGDCSAASNTGYRSAASNTGHRSAASNTGDCSAAISNGYGSKSWVEKSTSLAIASGKEGMAKGLIGSWIVVVERDDQWNIVCVKTAMIDGKKLKPDVFYTVKNKRFVEVKK
jgi:hypothetical protein